MTEISTLKQYLPYGKIAMIADKNNVDRKRAWDLLSGRVKPKDIDDTFIIDCIDFASAEKARKEKLNELLERLCK